MAKNAESKRIRDSLIKASRGSFTILHKALVDTAAASGTTKITEAEVEKRIKGLVAERKR